MDAAIEFTGWTMPTSAALQPGVAAAPACAPMLTGRQIRLARESLGWSEEQLAATAQVSATMIILAEIGADLAILAPREVVAVRFALEAAGATPGRA